VLPRPPNRISGEWQESERSVRKGLGREGDKVTVRWEEKGLRMKG